jgi:hypothetical protein
VHGASWCLYLIIAVGVPATICLVRWVAYFLFLVWIAHVHGPKAMRDAAVAVRAFPGADLAETIARLLRPK